MQQVTLWSRMNEDKEYEFNHLEMGHVAEGARFPTPKHENHKKTWARGEWKFEHARLTNDLPPKVVKN